MKINKSKSGISLIVLVITIIVMIILAAVIILSLNSSGIIGKANQAEQEYSSAQIKEAAMVARAELELEAADPSNASVTEVTASGLETKLKEKFGDNVAVAEEDGNYVITTNGVTVTIPTNKTNTEPETFTFEMGNKTYTAEQGMTWAEWVFSDYNTGYDNTSYGITTDGYIVIFYNGGDAYTNFTPTYMREEPYGDEGATTWASYGVKPNDAISEPPIEEFEVLTNSAWEYSTLPEGLTTVTNPNA